MPINALTGEPLPNRPEPNAQPPPVAATATTAEPGEPTGGEAQSPFGPYDKTAPTRRSASERERKIDALTASIEDYRERVRDLRDCASGMNPADAAENKRLLTLTGEWKKLERKVELWLGLRREIELSLMVVLKNGRVVR